MVWAASGGARCGLSEQQVTQEVLDVRDPFRKRRLRAAIRLREAKRIKAVTTP
jgi:hypothetical protein